MPSILALQWNKQSVIYVGMFLLLLSQFKQARSIQFNGLQWFTYTNELMIRKNRSCSAWIINTNTHTFGQRTLV